MKPSIKSLSALLLMGAMVTGCTSESGLISDLVAQKENGIKLAKAPDVIAYSGSHTLGTTTRANAGDGYIGNSTWEQFNTDKLTNITDEERQAVLKAIKDKVTGQRISEDVVFPWKDYFLQDVISGQNGNFEGAGSNGTSSSSYTFEAYNKGAECNQKYWPGYGYENYEEVTNSAHLNNYFQKQNADGSQTRINETTLMTGMEYGTYEEMKGKQFRWYINCHENLHWYEYIVVKVDGSYYICFDFGCGHPENDVDGNPGRGAEHNDWDYNDWILKITPAGNQPDVWDGQEDPKPNDKCDKCEHDSHEPGDCPECEKEGKTCPDEPVVTPDENPVVTIPNHVEVNLEVEEHKDYLATHLSIHVRAVTDVKVFIPVSAEYYCEADDMAIVQKHIFEEEGDQFMIHGGPQTLEYNINGTVVTLTVEFKTEGIYVTTKGIDKNVIDYLDKTFGDGITFEVWNYYNGTPDEEGRNNLKNVIDGKATVEFTDEPELYVNAFFYDDVDGTYTEEINPWDCQVNIVDDQRSQYEDPKTGWFYNNSTFNMLYKRYSSESTDTPDPETEE